MPVAFYAPMKPPGHPVPSGDRNMARAILAALSYAGADPVLASTLQTRDGRGDAARQRDLLQAAEAEVQRLIPVGSAAGWRAWVSYHNYYKAPDLIGPAVTKALGIPYLQIESTRARKRLQGPWAEFAQAAEDAADAADVIFYFTQHDAVALKHGASVLQRLIHLRPFIAQRPKPYAYAGKGPMLSVGMMRGGDKLASYQVIAETLAYLNGTDWHLDIAGDGPAQEQVETLMKPFGAQVKFLGACAPDQLQRAYENASLFFWPGVNEAFGMAYIEAQAAGLPIIAQDRPGVRDILPQGHYPSPDLGIAALADALQRNLDDPNTRLAASKASYANAIENHMLPAAAKTLALGLNAVGVNL